MKPRREFPLYLLTGATLGLALGLLIAWVLFPVQYVNTAPETLRADYKDEYRLLIAAAYDSASDLQRAEARLSTLGDPNATAALAQQAARSSGDAAVILQALADALLSDLPRAQATIASPVASPTNPPPTLPAPSATPPAASPTPTATPSPTQTPAALQSPAPDSSPIFAVTAAPSATAAARFIDTPIPRPTRAPTSTPGAPFALTSADVICEAGKTPGLVQVFVRDAANTPAPGIELIMTWNTGEERFFTGLKPELGNGYADFRMTPGLIYTLRFASGGASITDLYAPTCKNTDGSDYFGGLRLNFRQP